MGKKIRYDRHETANYFSMLLSMMFDFGLRLDRNARTLRAMKSDFLRMVPMLRLSDRDAETAREVASLFERSANEIENAIRELMEAHGTILTMHVL